MPVIGVGIDVVDIDRFVQSLQRTPSLRGPSSVNSTVMIQLEPAAMLVKPSEGCRSVG